MDHADFTFDLKHFAKDAKCNACHGTGRRGRGKCRKCEGTTSAGLEHPRYCFNRAYHDAWFDATEATYGVRAVVRTGAQSLNQVSVAYNFWYAAGYAFGLRDALAAAPTGTTMATLTTVEVRAVTLPARPESSEPAWKGWSGMATVGVN